MIDIIFLGLMVGLNALEAYIDSNIQKSQSADPDKLPFIKRWHLLDAIYKGAVFLMVAALIAQTWMDTIQLLMMFSMVRWAVFDAVLNKLNGQGFLYVGKVSYIDSTFQRFSNPGVTMVLFKLIIIVALVVLKLVILRYV